MLGVCTRPPLARLGAGLATFLRDTMAIMFKVAPIPGTSRSRVPPVIGSPPSPAPRRRPDSSNITAHCVPRKSARLSRALLSRPRARRGSARASLTGSLDAIRQHDAVQEVRAESQPRSPRPSLAPCPSRPRGAALWGKVEAARQHRPTKRENKCPDCGRQGGGGGEPR